MLQGLQCLQISGGGIIVSNKLITCKSCGAEIAASAKPARNVAQKTKNQYIKNGGSMC